MQKILKSLMVSILLVFFLQIPIFASSAITSINDLVKNAKSLDQQTVNLQGEAIGEPLRRGDYCWVNINDGTNAIGIWMKYEDSQLVQKYGDYKNKGDIIFVSGTFHRACSEHGGELDVHGDSIQISKDGYPINREISQTKMICSGILLATLLLGLYILHKFNIVRNPFQK